MWETPDGPPSRDAVHPGPNTPWAMLGSPANVEWVREIDNPPPGVATSASTAEVCSSPVHNATCPPVTSATGNPAPKACGTRTTSRLPVYTAVEP